MTGSRPAAKVRSDVEATAKIEAALYAAGRPLNMDELLRASGLSSKIKITEILDGITRRTRRAFTALEVVRLPDGSYVLQLKARVRPEPSESLLHARSYPGPRSRRSHT